MKRFAAAVLILVLSAPIATAQDKSVQTRFLSTPYETSAVAKKKDFAKELAYFLKIPSQKKQNCYLDVKKQHAFSGFVCALKREGIFSGSASSKFKPNTQLTWNIVIKSTCKARQWGGTSFNSCLSSAKKQGYLSSPLSRIRANNRVNFGHLEIFLSRVFGTSAGELTASQKGDEDAAANVDAKSMPPIQFTPLDFSPIIEQNISLSFFEHGLLSEVLPNRFTQHEVYFLEGDLFDRTKKDVLVFLCASSGTCTDSINFVGAVENGHFRIPINFDTPGNFDLGLIPGRKGTSRVASISVLPKAPDASSGEIPRDLRTQYKKDAIEFTWKAAVGFTQLTIFQNQQRRDYFFRQPISAYQPSAKDFKKFQKGPAFWFVTQGNQQSELQPITLTTHHYREIDSEGITVSLLTEFFPSIARFNFSATAKKKLSREVALIKTDGKVHEFAFMDRDVNPGESFTLGFDLDTPGTYIFELNDTEGKAVVNVPLYVGSGLPLVPDFFDLNDPVLNPALRIADLNASRATLLAMINSERDDFNLEPVTIDQDLNKTAQAHSDDMKVRNFFAHVNPDGLSPEDRRRRAQISTPVRENLARSATLEFAHEGLMRSPIHRDAILDPLMKRVGIGIAQNTEGYFHVTEHFAQNPFAKSDLNNLGSELFTTALEFRSAQNLSTLQNDANLRDVARIWSERMADESFFSLTAPNGAQLLDLIRERNIQSSVQMHALQAVTPEQLKDQIKTQNALKNAANRLIGIGLATNRLGELFLTSIYTP